MYNQTMKRLPIFLLLLVLLTGCGRGEVVTATSTPPPPLPTHTRPAPTATRPLPTLALPSPTPSPDVPFCRPQDLTGTSQTDAATGSITFNLKLINTSAVACRLPNPAKVELLAAGKSTALDLNPYYSCFLCEPTTTPGAPTLAPTPQAEAFARLLAETVDIPPDGMVQVFLIWSNWCGDPHPAIDIRFGLESGSLVVSSDASANPPCLVEAAPSSLMISQYLR